MEISFKLSTLVLTILLTGLSAGLCFTWSNAVTPGIGNLSDLGFLRSFQQMNRVIINPLFLIVFFGPFFLNLLNMYLYRNQPNKIFWMLVIAGVIYILGVVFITIFGNVPLNEMLDKTDLSSDSSLDLKALRDSFEDKWNKLHLVRTITSSISFSLLVVALIQISKTN